MVLSIGIFSPLLSPLSLDPCHSPLPLIPYSPTLLWEGGKEREGESEDNRIIKKSNRKAVSPP